MMLLHVSQVTQLPQIEVLLDVDQSINHHQHHMLSLVLTDNPQLPYLLLQSLRTNNTLQRLVLTNTACT